jgi:indole-3-glycerol phosphate synthase
MAATYLDRILEHHRARAAADTRSVERLLDEARAMPPARGFRTALADRFGVIAEIKRRSRRRACSMPTSTRPRWLPRTSVGERRVCRC